MIKTINILQIQSSHNDSSFELAEAIVLGLQKNQYSVTNVFLKDCQEQNSVPSAASESIHLDLCKKDISGLRIKAINKLANICKEKSIDIVIAHRFKPIYCALALNHFISLKKCIGVIHGIGDYQRYFRKTLIRLATKDNFKFVGVSCAVTESLVNLNCGFNQENTLTINNAIDINKAEAIQLTRAKARKALNLSEQNFIFGTIGRLVPAKGHIYLLQAMTKLKEKYPFAQVVIIGEGRTRQALEQYIKSNNLQKNVILLGAKENAVKYIKAFDVFVLPSLSEGLPLSLLEGLSGRLPVIGSDISSISPIIEGIGKTAQVKNANELASTMAYHLNLSKQELDALGDKHYQHLIKNYSLEQYQDKYRSLISID